MTKATIHLRYDQSTTFCGISTLRKPCTDSVTHFTCAHCQKIRERYLKNPGQRMRGLEGRKRSLKEVRYMQMTEEACIRSLKRMGYPPEPLLIKELQIRSREERPKGDAPEGREIVTIMEER